MNQTDCRLTDDQNLDNVTDNRDQRAAYQAPRVASGAVFERVALASGCNNFSFTPCGIPCD